MAVNKKYLVLKGCAGLGNRLVTVFAAINYCQKNNRTLVVDWSDGQLDKKNENAFDKCFCFSGFKDHTTLETIVDWESISHSSELFKANKYKSVYDLYFVKHSPVIKFLPPALVSHIAGRFIRNWQPTVKNNSALTFGSDLPDQQDVDVLYFVDFLPFISYHDLPKYVSVAPAIKHKIADYKIEQDIAKSIGVHVRYTDKKPSKQVKVLIDYLERFVRGRQIFLSTDSIEIEQIFRSTFNNVITYSKTKPQLSGEGLHQWALRNHVEDMKYIMFEESVIDMFLLSECEELLYQGNSTFSNISKVYHKDIRKCTDWQQIS